MIALSTFLIIYLVFILLGFLFLFFNVYHIAKFGLKARQSTWVLIAYFSIFFFAFLLGLVPIIGIDWTQSFTVQELFSFTLSGNPLAL